MAFFLACRIPRLDPPNIDPDLSSHKFAIFIPHNDVNYDESKIERMFRDMGATDVKKTEY